jgi:hypothetical protein
MAQLVEYLRDDAAKVTEPKAKALFKDLTEGLAGLAKAFEDYDQKCKAGWRRNSC